MKAKCITSSFIIILVIFCSCRQAETKTESEKSVVSSVAVSLTEAQKEQGWQLLFDGTSMDAWRTFRDAENNSWEVVDGTLHCKPFDVADKRADLITKQQYANFEVTFEWKIAPQSNSGVMFRVTEEYEQPFFSGPEYQLLDDGGYPGEVAPENFTGGNYAMHAPENKEVNPLGEWNSSRLVVDGTHVEHWLNGSKVVDYEINSDDWNRRKEAGKWKDEKGYAASSKGHIDLQDHGQEVWFRNILIRPLGE